MIELRRVLQAHLREALHEPTYYGFAAPTQPFVFGGPKPDVFYMQAHAEAVYPYLVYRLDSMPDGQGFELLTLDVDGWDAPEDKDTSPLERMMADLDSALNRMTLRSTGLAVTFHLDRKLALEDSDPSICRRRYVYQGRLFDTTQQGAESYV